MYTKVEKIAKQNPKYRYNDHQLKASLAFSFVSLRMTFPKYFDPISPTVKNKNQTKTKDKKTPPYKFIYLYINKYIYCV